MWTIVLGIAGLIVVALMVLFGADLVRASRTGPKWKRALVTASLAVLGAIGMNFAARDALADDPPPVPVQLRRPVPSCYLMVQRPDRPLAGVTLPARMAALKKLGVMEKIKPDVLKKVADQIRKDTGPYESNFVNRLPAGSGQRTKAQKTVSEAKVWVAAADIRLAAGDKPLADVPVWKTLATDWRDAEEAASGRKGRYPFDTKTKKRLLTALDAAPGRLDALATAGYLTDAEAGLLKSGLEGLPIRVRRMRATELKNATCYRPAPITNRDPMIAMLARMPLLEKVTQGGKLHPAAVKKITEVVEAEVVKLTDEKYLKGLTPDTRTTAGNLVKAARAAVKKLADAPKPKPKAKTDPKPVAATD